MLIRANPYDFVEEDKAKKTKENPETKTEKKKK